MPSLPVPSLSKTQHTLEGQASTNQKVAVLGLGFVGLPLAATCAELGFSVTGVDVSPDVIEKLQRGKAHFEEQGLQELLDTQLGKNLAVTAKLPPGEHDIYIIAVGTPIDEKTLKPNLSYIRSASEMIGKCLKKGDLVIMRSTVPVGTTRKVALPLLEKESGLTGGEDFDLVFAPERILSGKALQELRELPQIIGGLTGKRDVERAKEFFHTLTEAIVIVENVEAAELGKLMDNTYRDLTFAYANQMACLGEKFSVDVPRLVRDVNYRYKRNNIPVPSPGVGGICLQKDAYILLYNGEEVNYAPEVTKAARSVNEAMPHYVAEKVLRLLSEAGKDPKGARVFILGFAFKGKPETSDTRGAPTNVVVKELQKAGCAILGYDPVVPKEKIAALGIEVSDLAEGFERADAVVVMTNHQEFEAMDIATLLGSMEKPAVFLDGWHLFDPEKIKAIKGIHYGGVGND